MTDIETIITELIDREGRAYTNDSADRGNHTKFGITIAALSRYRGRPCVPADVEHLEEPEARNIYRNDYLTSIQLHRIKDPYVMVLAFDIGVNHGTHRAVRWLQQIAGVPADGVFGNQTEIAVNSMDPARLYQRLIARRVRFIGEIIAHDPERKRASQDGYKLQAKFASGWCNRAAGFIEDQVS